MKVKTTWEHSIKTETERVLHCAHQIAVNFYRINNFVVLPHTPKSGSLNLVTFPDLPYSHVPRFWDKVKTIDITTLPLKKIDKKTMEKTGELLKTVNLPKPNIEALEKTWVKAQDQILTKIYEIIPNKKGRIKKIIIYPTVFGTSCSFNFINENGEIIMYLRQDQGLTTIVEAIVTSLTRKDVYEKLDGIWQESEIIADWLVTQSALAEVIRKYDKTAFIPTLKGVRIKQQVRLLAESEAFYKKLGFSTNQKIFGLNGLTPEINKKPVENLSPAEKAILRLLIQKAGGIITFDELGNEIFKDDQNFSLYAISKTIERLRNKFEANGISGSYIQTLRGKGYLLKN